MVKFHEINRFSAVLFFICMRRYFDEYLTTMEQVSTLLFSVFVFAKKKIQLKLIVVVAIIYIFDNNDDRRTMYSKTAKLYAIHRC